MGEEHQQVLRQNVSVVLDEILARHMERLLGSRFGIDGLPMNLRNITCITLLTDGMGFTETPPSASAETHTLESLKAGLGDIGLSRDEDLQPLLEELIRKGYAFAYDNKFFPGKPAFTMAQVLGRLFPKMMGAAFLGYIVQSIDEVSTGRKDLEAAALQFDQTLKMQGVPLKRGAEQPAPPKTVEGHGRPKDTGVDSPPRAACRPRAPKIHVKREEGRVRVLGASVDSLVFEVRQAETLIPPSSEPSPGDGIREGLEAGEALDEQDTGTGALPADREPAAAPGPLSDVTPEPPVQTREEAGTDPSLPLAESLPSPPSDPEPEPAADPAEPQGQVPECTAVDDEDSLEKRIAWFEEELASQCPLCKTSAVRQRKTAAGRTYFQCGNPQCSFVSWGRPHHVSCPRCKNPFMVEVPEPGGRPLLRCPRATCRYIRALSSPAGDPPLQDLASGQGTAAGGDPGADAPRRRVVRRRVVRKKK
ncbi:MAG: hypothetical protein AB1512_31400 [Thermodesulfobacteriota bacterium]